MSEDIDKIITHYLEGSLSQEEQTKLDVWLEQDQGHHQQLAYLIKVWKTPVGYPGIINMKDERDKIWKRLQKENGTGLERGLRSVSFYRVVLRYVAVLIIVLGLAFIIDYYVNTSSDSEFKVTMIERINPAGQKSKIYLPDGSTVWLNAGSKLSYNSDFNSGSRKLTLVGEAYFEVTKNPHIPFEVYTNDLLITVIGTSFNVQAFVENIEQVALNTGKVKIECLDREVICAPNYLKPGDLAEFNKSIGSIELSRFEGEDPFGWKDGKIIFSHATFSQVLKVLSRWYNVDFTVEGKLEQQWNYSATFENEVLENILASLKFSEKIDYKFNGSTITIIL